MGRVRFGEDSGEVRLGIRVLPNAGVLEFVLKRTSKGGVKMSFAIRGKRGGERELFTCYLSGEDARELGMALLQLTSDLKPDPLYYVRRIKENLLRLEELLSDM